MQKRDHKDAIDQSWQLRRKKRLRDAELVLLEAMAEYPAGSYEHRLLSANLADVLLRQGNFSEARKIAFEVLQKEPSQAIALTVLGEAALEQKETAEAVENLNQAYACAPNPYRAGRLARALELDGQQDKAKALLYAALQKYPGDNYLIRQYSHLTEKAPVKDKEDLLPAELCPDEEAFLPYAERIKAQLKHLHLDPIEAVCQLQKIIKVGKRKENPHLHLLAGDLLRKAGKESDAAQAYYKARELDPENLLALSQLTYSCRRLGRKDEAWPLLKLLLEHRPGDQTAKAALLKDAVELGKADEAAVFLKELIYKYPYRKELYGLLRRLKLSAGAGQEKL
jgi:tetratricopeptide (TPR) repeat protein